MWLTAVRVAGVRAQKGKAAKAKAEPDADAMDVEEETVRLLARASVDPVRSASMTDSLVRVWSANCSHHLSTERAFASVSVSLVVGLVTGSRR
jgi:hypothetical protein